MKNMKIQKILLGATLLLLIIGAGYAANNNEIFKAPSGLHTMGVNDFVDEKGHNIRIDNYTDNLKSTWFENDTENGYLVQPSDSDKNIYIYAADENDCGLLEIVKKDDKQYIINCWTPKGASEAKVVAKNLEEFNKLNNLKPLPVEG